MQLSIDEIIDLFSEEHKNRKIILKLNLKKNL